MTFRSAYLKLTAFYVLIVMVISVIFSVAIYNISSREIGRGLGPQTRVLRDLPIINNPMMQDLERMRLEQLEESGSRLRQNLIYLNLLILILSSVISYFLAKKTLRPIEEAMEAQRRFTADASHELRTPLTAMRSEIEVNLRDKKMNLTEAKKLLRSSLEEVNKIESLSSMLLELAKYQEETKLEFKKISLIEVVTEAYEKVEKLAKSKGIQFRTDLKQARIEGDKQSLVELFVILFDNAIKYSSKDSWISVSIIRTDKHAIVKIKDRGTGIAPENLPHIFDRFYRADNSRSKGKTKGYGLGLAIAKSIVELHSGTISAKSSLGRGTEFTIHF